MRIQIRTTGIPLTKELTDRVSESFAALPEGFGTQKLEQVIVRLADVGSPGWTAGGPRSWEDQSCRAELQLDSGLRIFLTVRGAPLFPLIDEAARRSMQTLADLDRRVFDERRSHSRGAPAQRA